MIKQFKSLRNNLSKYPPKRLLYWNFDITLVITWQFFECLKSSSDRFNGPPDTNAIFIYNCNQTNIESYATTCLQILQTDWQNRKENVISVQKQPLEVFY